MDIFSLYTSSQINLMEHLIFITRIHRNFDAIIFTDTLNFIRETTVFVLMYVDLNTFEKVCVCVCVCMMKN